MSSPGYEPHVDKIVSVLGEIGIASNYPICWRGDHGDVNGLVSDMLSDSLMRFSPDQELEFTAKAFLYYLPGGSRWKNRLGDEWSLSAILERLASRNPNEGCCAGTHRLHVFALALNLDRAEPFLSPDLRSLLHLKLREASELLRDTQEKDGCWSTGWFGPGWPARDLGEPALASHLRVVGHHLEWFALSEEGDRPPRETIRSAMAYTQRSLASIDSLFIYQYYPPLSHAVRGLVLLSGQAPTSLDSRGPSKRIEGD